MLVLFSDLECFWFDVENACECGALVYSDFCWRSFEWLLVCVVSLCFPCRVCSIDLSDNGSSSFVGGLYVVGCILQRTRSCPCWCLQFYLSILVLLCICFYRCVYGFWEKQNMELQLVSKSTRNLRKEWLDRQDIRRFVAELGVASLGQIVGHISAETAQHIGVGGNLESSM